MARKESGDLATRNGVREKEGSQPGQLWMFVSKSKKN